MTTPYWCSSSAAKGSAGSHATAPPASDTAARHAKTRTAVRSGDLATDAVGRFGANADAHAFFTAEDAENAKKSWGGGVGRSGWQASLSIPPISPVASLTAQRLLCGPSAFSAPSA